MEGESVLQLVAEVAVAFTGFTGVVAALGHRSLGQWRPVDVVRFRGMLGSSLMTLGFALLPFVLHHVGIPPRTYWAICSGTLGLVYAVWFRHLARLQRHHEVEKDPDFVPGFRRFAFTIGFLVILSQGLNALGIGFDRSLGGYLVGLFWLLFMCSGLFVLLLRFVRVERQA